MPRDQTSRSTTWCRSTACLDGRLPTDQRDDLHRRLLDPVDQHVTFTISDIQRPCDRSPPIIGSRLVFNGQAGNGTYLTMPSNCAGGARPTTLHVDSHAAAANRLRQRSRHRRRRDRLRQRRRSNRRSTQPRRATCRLAGTDHGRRRDPVRPERRRDRQLVPEDGESRRCRKAWLNPRRPTASSPAPTHSSAKGTNNPITCPAASKIGTVEVQTAVAAGRSRTATSTSAQPTKARTRRSGEQFRIFIHASRHATASTCAWSATSSRT